MVIMETPTRNPPIERQLFQKQLDVAIAQFGLSYPCMLKDTAVDLYKLYCFVRVIESKNQGDVSYANNVESWRQIAEEMGYKGDINAMVLFKIYNRYIVEGYEKSSSNLSGVPSPKSARVQPQFRQFLPLNHTPEIVRQKNVYKKRRVTPSTPLVSSRPAKSVTVTPIRYNKSVSCTRFPSRGASPPSDSRDNTLLRSLPTISGPTSVRTPTIRTYKNHLSGAKPVENLWDIVNRSVGEPTATIQRIPANTASVPTGQQKAKFQQGGELQSTSLQSGKMEVPTGFVLEGGYLVDDGILPKPTGPTEKYKVHPIIRQLESGLPNEVQFGLNMLLWLTKSWSLPLPKYPRLLDALLSSSGLVNAQTKELLEDSSMCEFWTDSQQESSFFNNDFEAQQTRATQISVIISNLSHTRSNSAYLLKSPVFPQYLLQSLKSRCIPIRNNAVITLSLIANEMELGKCTMYTDYVFKKVPEFMASSDRFLITSALEVITNLCKTPANHLFVVEQLTLAHYKLMVQLLLVPDVQLLHTLLESMHSLTSIGMPTCEQFLSATHCFSLLTDLLSCTAERLQHRGIKVLRFVRQTPKEPVADVIKPQLEEKAGLDSKGTKEKKENKEAKEVKALVPVYPVEMAEPVKFATHWIRQGLRSSVGSILLKSAVYSRYVQAATAASTRDNPAEVVSTTDFFTLLASIIPKSYRQKIFVGDCMKFVLKNADWNNTKTAAPKISSSRLNSVPKKVFEASSVPKKVFEASSVPPSASPLPQSPLPPSPLPPSPPHEDNIPSKVKINALPLANAEADDPFQFVSERLEDEGDGEFNMSRKKKKKEIHIETTIVRAVVAEIIEEEMEVDPRIIEETESNKSKDDIDCLSPEKYNESFSSSPRNFQTYSGKRKMSPEPQSSNAFDTFGRQQPSEYNKYKKTLTLDLFSTPEKKARVIEEDASHFLSTCDASNSPAFGKIAKSQESPTFARSASPTFDMVSTIDKPAPTTLDPTASPAYEKTTLPVFDKSSSPTFEKAVVSPTFDRATSPTFDRTASPTFAKAVSPNFDRTVSPTFGKAVSPTFGRAVSPTFDKATSPTFDRTASPTFAKAASPTFDKAASPTFGKAASPTFDKASSMALDEATAASYSTPTFDKIFDPSASPTFDKAASPTFDRTASPTFGKAASPTFAKAASPTFAKAVSPTFDKAASPTFDRTVSPTFGKAASPTFDRTVSPTFGKAASPTFDRTVSPTFVKAASPTFGKAASPTFDKGSSLALDEATAISNSTPTFDKIFDPSASPTFEMIASSTFDKETSLSIKKTPSPSLNIDARPAQQIKDIISEIPEKCEVNKAQLFLPISDEAEAETSKRTALTSFDKSNVCHTNSVTSEISDLSISPLITTEQATTDTSDKLQIDADIMVPEVDTGSYTSKYSTVTYSTPHASPSDSSDSNKTVPKTVVSNHIRSDPVSSASFVPEPCLASSNGVLQNAVAVLNGEGTVQLTKMSPLKSQHQIFASNQQYQIIAPKQNEMMLVNEQHSTGQQMILVPHSATQQRIILSDHQSPTQQMIIVPNAVSQQNVVVNNQQVGAQQSFISSDQHLATGQQMIIVPHSAAQQNLVINSQPSSVQQMIIVPNNGPQQNVIVNNQQVCRQQLVVLPQPSQQQGVIVNNQQGFGQQMILVPNPANQQKVGVNDQQTVGHKMIVIPQSSQCNQQQVLMVPQNPVFIAPQTPQVFASPTCQPAFIPNSSQTSPGKGRHILIAPHTSASSAAQIRISPTKPGLPLLISSKQQTSPRLVVLPQASSDSVQLQQIMISSHSSPLIISPVINTSTSRPMLISSLTGGRISTNNTIVASSHGLMTSSHGLMTSSHGLMTSSHGLVTSCTSMYSNPVVCATPVSTQCTYTLSKSPAKLPVLSPMKVAHISPVKIVNGSILTNAQNVTGVSRSLTKIAPRSSGTSHNTGADDFQHHTTPNTKQPVFTKGNFAASGVVSSSEAVSISETVSTSGVASTSGVSSTSEAASTSGVATPSSIEQRKRSLPPRRHTYPCYWDQCTEGFEGESQLSEHLFRKHVTKTSTACQWITCSEKTGTRSKYSLIFHLKSIHARAPSLTHLPTCTYTRDRIRDLLSRSRGWSDSPESPITRSIRLLLALIIRDFLRFTPELVGDVTAFEEVFAMIAMSSMEASKVMTDILGLITDSTDDKKPVFGAHLPPFR